VDQDDAMSNLQNRRFAILADGTQHLVTRAHYERQRHGDLVFHVFYTTPDDRVDYAQSDIDRIDEILEGNPGSEGKLLRQPLWPAPGNAAPEAVHGHELPARWRDLGSIEMAGLAEKIGVDLSMLTVSERSSESIRDLIVGEIDWVEP
jgi:hypothetical protein